MVARPFICHTALPQSLGTRLPQVLLHLDAFRRTEVGILPLFDRALHGEILTHLPGRRARPVGSGIDPIRSPTNSACDARGRALRQQRQADVEQQSFIPRLARDRIRGDLAETGARRYFELLKG